MRGAIPQLPQYAFMAWCLVKHRDNFTFTFIIVTVVRKLHALKKEIYERFTKEGPILCTSPLLFHKEFNFWNNPITAHHFSIIF
jgi:hypothetical protein